MDWLANGKGMDNHREGIVLRLCETLKLYDDMWRCQMAISGNANNGVISFIQECEHKMTFHKEILREPLNSAGGFISA